MGVDFRPEAPANSCRLLVRKKPGPAEIIQLVVGGVEIGQQIVVLAGPAWLKELARLLSENGLRPETLLRNGRLVFLTAPDCLSRFAKLDSPCKRPIIRRNGSIVRWISDWSWAYQNGFDPPTILQYQRKIHKCIHQIATMSVCTVHCEKMERSSMLAVLVQHRRAARAADHLQ
ncbi:MAG: MEDS domain-containing protein [Acidobacteriota bacterium]